MREVNKISSLPFEKRIPVVRGTTRTDERPAAHAMMSEQNTILSVYTFAIPFPHPQPVGWAEGGTSDERECHPLGQPLARPSALTLSGHIMRHLCTA